MSQIHDKVSEWRNMSTLGLFFFFGKPALKIQLIVLVLYKADAIIISSNVSCPCHDVAVKIVRYTTITHTLK